MLSPSRASRGTLHARPFAAAFLARMQSEGLCVAAFASAVPTSNAVTRAEVLEGQVPGFRFDFIVHRGTMGAWRESDSGQPTLILTGLSAACCVLACPGTAPVEARDQDAV